MIDPGEIPQYTGDFDQLSKAVTELRKRAVGIRNNGQDVHSRFQATAAYYQAPEADQLFSSTQPVMDTADEFAAHIESLADALDTFVAEAKPHADRLKRLREKAIAFVDSVQGDDDWNKDQDKRDAHEALMNGVAEAVAGFWAAEQNAADKINHISPAMCRPVAGGGSQGSGGYAVSADTLKSMDDLPWGSPEERTYDRWSLGWWGHGIKSWAWDGIVKDSIWGGFVGLGVLVDNLAGINGSQARHDTWDGLRRTVVGAYAYGMDAVGLGDHLSDWQRGSEAYTKEFGKQFVAYDMWDEDPARAHAVTSFNLLTLFAGGAGGLARLGKAGRLTEAAGTVAKVGDVLDPISGTARAAGALSDLPKVSEVLTHVSDHLKFPKPHFPNTALDLSDRYRIDKNGNFIPLHPDGTPDLTPPRREHTASDRVIGVPTAERHPVGVGAQPARATAHVVGELSPDGHHEGTGTGGNEVDSHRAGYVERGVPDHGAEHGPDAHDVPGDTGLHGGGSDGGPPGDADGSHEHEHPRDIVDALLEEDRPLSSVPPSLREQVAEELSKRYAVPKEAFNHVLFGEIKNFQAQGWHVYDMAMPDRRVIPGTLRIAPNGTLNADITMLDGNGRWIEKKSIEHTFFPQDWTVRDVIEVGDRLSRETPKRGKVKITYKGVKVVGLVNKDKLSTFFPGG
ncbi:EndoU domain-containing protein [Streptomyces mexicanus]|uniref:EndoU domain-containing protein n=1 Tax=Streptomyces mexicanus TaxID=178566 RepID=UPI0036CF596C